MSRLSVFPFSKRKLIFLISVCVRVCVCVKMKTWLSDPRETSTYTYSQSHRGKGIPKTSCPGWCATKDSFTPTQTCQTRQTYCQHNPDQSRPTTIAIAQDRDGTAAPEIREAPLRWLGKCWKVPRYVLASYSCLRPAGHIY